MSERVKRAAPLVAVRARVVDEKRTAFATAARAARSARETAVRAEAAWEQQVAHVGASTHATVSEHAEARAHLESLRRVAMREAQLAAAAERDEHTAREALLVAERELKKIEIWRDGLIEEERAIAERIERLAADELAARVHRTRS